jgi:hypothetical protein
MSREVSLVYTPGNGWSWYTWPIKSIDGVVLNIIMKTARMDAKLHNPRVALGPKLSYDIPAEKEPMADPSIGAGRKALTWFPHRD